MSPKHHSFYERLLGWLRPAANADEIDDRTVVMTAKEGGPRLSSLPAMISDRYQIIRTVGRGSFGVVYLARDQRIGRLIAVKVLYSQYRRQEEIYQRFIQEARIAGQLEHPNIVTIYDVEDDGKNARILMEYLGGGHLGGLLGRDQRPLDQRAALLHLRGIVTGLGTAHQRAVVHRDIKPRNILFDQNGIPKISDFGIAHLPIEAGGIDVDGDLTTFGTPAYMAPEQMIPGHPIDQRADLYAAGLLLYEMLTGRRRFEFDVGMGFGQMLELVKARGAAPLEDFHDDTAEAVIDLVVRLTQPEPAQRPNTADDVLATINEVLEGLHLQGDAPDKPVTIGTRQVRREMFEDILRLFLVDGVISAPERRELVKRANRLGVMDDHAWDSEERVRAELGLPLRRDLNEYAERVEALMSEREYTEEDRRILRALGRKLSISVAEQRKIEETTIIRSKMK